MPISGAQRSSPTWLASLTDPQRAIVERLLGVYAGNLRQDLANQELQRIAAAGIGHLRFAWMGSDKPGEGHYYRLSGPTFVIEYDNTQGGANHVHTVWRDRQRDFGRDLLKEHHEHDHPHRWARDPASRPARERGTGLSAPARDGRCWQAD